MTDSEALHFDNSGTENYYQLGVVSGGISVQEQGDYRNYQVTDMSEVNPKELLTATGSFGLGLKGYSFRSSVTKPDDAAIALASNWARVGGLKDGAGVRVTSL